MAVVTQLRSLGLLLLMVFLFLTIKWERIEQMYLLVTSIIVGMILSLHGIIEKTFHRTMLVPNAWTNWKLSDVNTDRVYGMVGNPNVLAMYLLFIFFLTFAFEHYATKPNKVLLYISRTVILGTALLTYSRGAFLAYLLGLIVYIIVSKNWKFLVRVLLVGVISIVMIYYPTNMIADQSASTDSKEEVSYEPEHSPNNKSFLERIRSAIDEETISDSTEWGRIYIILKGIEIFKDHPLTGVGLATFGDAATLKYSSPIYEKYGIPEKVYADNQYIYLLVSTGVIGYFLLIWFIVSLTKKLILTLPRLYVNVFISSTIVLLISSLFYNTLEDKTFMIFYYSLLGFLIQLGADHDW
ncbi:O-antigen ligase family protein [Halalkalibacillus sediminis]|uniref:O-antigen ligase family protein n=1 Tax=Halalkalibacillus sediminis TaxID=2018042 RepID=UPI0013901C66|nr:O-antigen ligase family protein [Halalkalibacillus sediminis]